MKKIGLTLLGILILGIAYVLFNTFTFSSKQTIPEPYEKEPIPLTARTHLATAISIPTISYENSRAIDSAAFYRFRDFIKTTYPLSDSLLQVDYVNEFSIIYTWRGNDTSLKPTVLLGHIDVVPVTEENLKKWHVPPFSGKIEDGIIWGRGAIDNKNSVIGIMEAVELLLQQNFTPQRTVYLCFGHDEEIGGRYGAVAMAAMLKKQGEEAEFIVDEGYAITQGLIPGVEKDVAIIGTGEKGYVTFELSVALEGGHSSMPNSETAIDVLSEAIVKLKTNPFPPKISQPLYDFMQHMGPEMPFVHKMAFANPAIFKPLIFNIYKKSPSSNALIRTTTSPTIIKAGIKDNVIPYTAKASVNFRILPGTTVAEVKERILHNIDDNRIVVKEVPFADEPSEVSSTSSIGYKVLDKTIKQIFPQVLTTPNLVIGATDARHYAAISKNSYRFTPFYLNNDNINTFHGINERIPVEDFDNTIRFYMQLIRNVGQQSQ